MTFDRRWFDKISFNTREEKGGVGVHILKAGKNCRYFRIDLTDMDAPDFWDRVMAQAREVWATDDPEHDPCPTCGSEIRLWKRRYQSRSFCGFCGTPL